jgi:hypothetical protein
MIAKRYRLYGEATIDSNCLSGSSFVDHQVESKAFYTSAEPTKAIRPYLTRSAETFSARYPSVRYGVL